MKKYILLTATVCLVFSTGLAVYGAEDTFETRLSVVADDYAPPSIPTGLIASALSSTVINLTWNAATDDVGVIGYRIFRDGIGLGTTTSIFYQDSGLTASTSYDYTVESFDSVPNFSGQSVVVTAVTLDTPVVSSNPEPSSGSRRGSRVTSTQTYDFYPLANVTNPRAIPSEKSIALTWNNPSSQNFDGVRIVRSDKFFPRDIYDGEVVYQGQGEMFTDRNIALGKAYYYTIFSIDTGGLYSSGILLSSYVLGPGERGIGTILDPLAGVTFISDVHPQIAGLLLSDFDFIQDGKKIALMRDGLVVDSSRNLTISLDYSKVPELLKTIVVTLTDPQDSSLKFSFLLRVNKTKTAYEAILAPLVKSGAYAASIVILDYKNQGLKKIEAHLRALSFLDEQQAFEKVPRVSLTQFAYYLAVVGVLLLILRMVFRK